MSAVFPRNDAVRRDSIAPRTYEYAGNDFLDELLGGGGHELCASIGAAIGQSFFVAYGDHATVDGVGVREFAGFGGEGLGVAFADFEVPV